MATDSHHPPSFSPGRKWSIGLQTVLLVALVFSVVVMANYLSRDYFTRFHWSDRTRHTLSTRTLRFLSTLTNRVQVTVYCNQDKSVLYSAILGLLDEYHYANPRITVETVDYQRDPTAAQRVKARYNLATTAKDLIVFDAGGKPFAVEADALREYTYERTEDKDVSIRRKLIAFNGEKMFTAALIAVTNPKLNAYYLLGHGEHPLDNPHDPAGYGTFKQILQLNYIDIQPLQLDGTNRVPADCSLLIIAGPTTPFREDELRKIEQYLSQGGRLMALFRTDSFAKQLGLESVLAKWGVAVGHNVVTDYPEHSSSEHDIIVSAFSRHPVVNSLFETWICLVLPRTISALPVRAAAADAPRVEEIAKTGSNAVVTASSRSMRGQVPLAVAVEKGAIKDVVTERGTTRIVVVGDSYFLANGCVDQLGNSQLAATMANWLINRTQLLDGIDARPPQEYRLVITKAQMRRAEWVVLAGLPGATLLLGGLVWLRRRG